MYADHDLFIVMVVLGTHRRYRRSCQKHADTGIENGPNLIVGRDRFKLDDPRDDLFVQTRLRFRLEPFEKVDQEFMILIDETPGGPLTIDMDDLDGLPVKGSVRLDP